MEGRDLDVILLELSGVADPVAVKNNWISYGRKRPGCNPIRVKWRC